MLQKLTICIVVTENFKCHVLLHKFKLKGMLTELFCDAISLLRCV
jgi:hypothetical protein